ncbi:hypothetical protein ACIBO4_03185 [Streptomyces sp. NPDC050149]|uniref:hypothetical protein n=1 Tax=Streptomyces sp. NPDC050149 TaxID=3365603 RepID=UPI0037BA4CDB
MLTCQLSWGSWHALAEPLTRPADSGDPATPAGEEQELPADLLESHPAVCARDCLLGYAVSRATWDGKMPGDVLDLTAGVLAARGGEEVVTAVLGAHLPLLHRRPPRAVRARPWPAIAGRRVAARTSVRTSTVIPSHAG